MQTLLIFQLVSLFAVGLITEAAGFAGFLYPPLSFLLGLPFLWLLKIISLVLYKFKDLNRWDRALIISLISIWLLHFLQVLVPETGFDAVWYHLPIIEQFVQAHRISYIPEFYQSLNPLFSDLIFLLGYQISGDLGAKLVAYFFGVSLILVSYQLSRYFLNRSWSLLAVVIISTFQVVAWQSASFYIDLAKAMWEVASLWLLIKGSTKQSALMFGASLATKLFSILLYPVMLVSIRLINSKQKIAAMIWYFAISLGVVMPFYVFTYLKTGNPFYSLTRHAHDLVTSSWFEQILKLPHSLFDLTFGADYTTAIFLVLLPIFVYWLIKTKHSAAEKALLIFSAGQYLIWWFVPPLSTRYALAGFITLLIIYMKAAHWLINRNKIYRLPIYLTIMILTAFSLAPRIFVAQRSAVCLIDKQTKEQYIGQFYDGWIDEPLRKWHRL